MNFNVWCAHPWKTAIHHWRDDRQEHSWVKQCPICKTEWTEGEAEPKVAIYRVEQY